LNCGTWIPGCGSGLSGETLTEHGHHWIGCDISESMLGEELHSPCCSLLPTCQLSCLSFCSGASLLFSLADVALEREAEGDLLLADMGEVNYTLCCWVSGEILAPDAMFMS
jgi:18S rRNA (guanine1575-N7)-methyltransferase